MPRKPSLPKHNLVIQSLSTGEVLEQRTYVDDFTGEVMPMAERHGPIKPPEDLFAKRDAQRKQAVKDKLLALKLLGIVPGAESVRPKPAPKAGPFKRRL